MYRLRFACGATYEDITDDPRGGASHARKDGALRYAVADTDTDVQRPTLPDVGTARCMFDCPAKARVSGRKRIQCFPADPSEASKHWRYVVTCYGHVEQYEVQQ